MLKPLFQAALDQLDRGKPAVLAAITASQGSTPRTTGAAMVVGESGLLAGTIGGGELERQCVQLALNPPQPLMHFELNHVQAAQLGMVCGGSAQVLFTPLTDRDLLVRALEGMETPLPAWLLLPLDGGAPALVEEGDLPDHPAQVEQNGAPHLSLPLMEGGRVFILGGGHVALELARLLDQLGYPHVVVDDRPEFASRDRFPVAREVLVCPFPELGRVLTGPLAPGSGDCLCIMTRGHLADTDALRFALATPAGYIGVMGSRRKREKVFATLAQEGFPDAPQRVTTPIGLPIGGQTPAELAVSVAAQLIQWRYGKNS